jgi:ABC-2 type transport system permease protein
VDREVQAFPHLLLPQVLASRNRVRRRQRGDTLRAAIFGGIGVVVMAALFAAAFFLTYQVGYYAEFGDYLLRLGLSWLFLTFLSFLAFSGVVTALSVFFLSDDLRLLLAAPIASRRLFYARFARTVAQSSWMVLVFLVPVLAGVGTARCACPGYYATAVLTTAPFVVIPTAVGCLVTLLLVNVFPARRAKDILFLMGLLFAAAIVVLLRFIRPERLLRVETLPDVTAFFATLQSPVTPLLPSFWAGETLFASLQGDRDLLHFAALWSTAFALVVLSRIAYDRWYFPGFSKSQEARKVSFTRLTFLDRVARFVPLSVPRRSLLIKDVKVFLRDVSQWSQLLLLVALMLIYLYNFRVMDLDRMPMISDVLKNVYAFINLAMAGLVMATVAVRFVFPAVSMEGAAFWIVRTSPVPLREFLWSKFWIGLVPVLVLSEVLTIAGNRLLGVDPFLARVAAAAILFMSVALVGLAVGLGARYPRFSADSAAQAAGSYGGVAFMIVAVLYVIAIVALIAWPSIGYIWHRTRGAPFSDTQKLMMAAGYLGAVVVSVGAWRYGMRTGVKALEAME